MSRVALIGVLPLVALTACSGGDPGAPTLDVLAASSLTDTFEVLADEFEDAHPGVEVRLSFSSSATLAQQVLEGAPADVLATADLATMQRAADGGAVTDPAIFASNRMVVVTPAGRTAIDEVDDLDEDGVTFVTCVESAPCGHVASRLLEENEVGSRPVSLESDVKAVLTKVVSGEVDAGFVYVTDAEEAGGKVRSVPVPGSAEQLTSYALAVIEQSDDPELAQEWAALVISQRGRQVLRSAGFGAARGAP